MGNWCCLLASTHYLIVCGTADFTCSVSVVDKQPEAVQVTLRGCQVGRGVPLFVFPLRVKLKFRQDLSRREEEREREKKRERKRMKYIAALEKDRLPALSTVITL